MRITLCLAALSLAACDRASDPSAGQLDATAPADVEPAPRAPESNAVEAGAPTPRLVAASERVLAEWRSADNRESCAPIGFTDTGGAEADARHASFSGGWAVAFDQPGARSQYGVAGTGVQIGAFDAEISRIRQQWPYSRPLDGLKTGAVAAYGVEGAAPYPADNADGDRLNSLAYVVIPGQRCLYNVWSHLGRRHLETLLDGLVLIPTG